MLAFVDLTHFSTWSSYAQSLQTPVIMLLRYLVPCIHVWWAAWTNLNLRLLVQSLTASFSSFYGENYVHSTLRCNIRNVLSRYQCWKDSQWKCCICGFLPDADADDSDNDCYVWYHSRKQKCAMNPGADNIPEKSDRGAAPGEAVDGCARLTAAFDNDTNESDELIVAKDKPRSVDGEVVVDKNTVATFFQMWNNNNIADDTDDPHAGMDKQSTDAGANADGFAEVISGYKSYDCNATETFDLCVGKEEGWAGAEATVLDWNLATTTNLTTLAKPLIGWMAELFSPLKSNTDNAFSTPGIGDAHYGGQVCTTTGWSSNWSSNGWRSKCHQPQWMEPLVCLLCHWELMLVPALLCLWAWHGALLLCRWSLLSLQYNVCWPWLLVLLS